MPHNVLPPRWKRAFLEKVAPSREPEDARASFEEEEEEEMEPLRRSQVNILIDEEHASFTQPDAAQGYEPSGEAIQEAKLVQARPEALSQLPIPTPPRA